MSEATSTVGSVIGNGAPAATPPATPPSTPATPATTTTTSDWTSGLAEDVKGYVQTKGFKDPASVVESYRNLEKTLGVPKERLLKLPEKADAPEWGEIYNRLGKPEKADEYQIAMPEKGGDEAFAKWAKETFHGLNLTRTQGEQLSAKWNEYVGKNTEAQQAQQAAKVEQDVGKLKQEWGAAHEQNVNIARRAAQTFGLQGDMVDRLESAIGFGPLMKMLHTIGSKLGEDSFVGADSKGGAGIPTPSQANYQIKTLKQDTDFMRRFASGETAARDMWEKLHRYAAGG